MKRYFMNCRDYPSDVKCALALSSDTKEELLEAKEGSIVIIPEKIVASSIGIRVVI